MEPRATKTVAIQTEIERAILEEQAELYRKRALSLNKSKQYESARKNCQLSLETYAKIRNQDANFYRKVTEAYHTLGDINFNDKKYVDAALAYDRGTHQMENMMKLNMNFEDDDYRILIGLFINLSDAYMHLDKRDASTDAFKNAIKAFELIKWKTAQERKVANANDNYQSFRVYHEAQLSGKTYLSSHIYEQNGNLFQRKQDEKVVANMLGDLGITPAKQEARELSELISNMSFTPQSPFIPIPAQQNVNDDEYRSMIQDLVSLANESFKQQLIPQTIKSLKRAISVHQHIQMKTDTDNTLVQNLSSHVQQLKNQQQQNNIQQPLPAVGPSRIGVFGTQNLSQTNPDTSMQDEKPDNEMWRMGFG